MEEPAFTLNNRFFVKPSLGLINDAQTSLETRIEPRLMSLLCLLAENNERLVARPLITKQIWNDYGNADEGLTQAISYLRKVLADESKLLIETVPKKGYVLHAKVLYDEREREEESKYVHGARRGKFMLIGAIVFVLIIAAAFFYKWKQVQKQGNPDVIPATQNSANPDAGRRGGGADTGPDTVTRPQTGADKVKR